MPAAVALATAACGDTQSVDASRFAPVDPDGWPADSPVAVDLSDSTRAQAYRTVMLAARLDYDYPYSQLRLALESVDEAGHEHVDTVTVPVERPRGERRESYGMVSVADTIWIKRLVGPDCSFEIRQITSPEPLVGVNDIGLILLKN